LSITARFSQRRPTFKLAVPVELVPLRVSNVHASHGQEPDQC